MWPDIYDIPCSRYQNGKAYVDANNSNNNDDGTFCRISHILVIICIKGIDPNKISPGAVLALHHSHSFCLFNSFLLPLYLHYSRKNHECTMYGLCVLTHRSSGKFVRKKKLFRFKSSTHIAKRQRAPQSQHEKRR